MRISAVARMRAVGLAARDVRPSRARGCAPGRKFVLATLALLALAAGCAPKRPPSPPPPPAGYAGRVDALGFPDSLREATGRNLFAGRRLAIDPGHGGFFRGSLGVAGLAEADVNLGVALKLRDLLVAQGADVLLTRDTDRDFLTPADSSLRSDLNARVALANGFQPDLFVSIHHNADAGGAHDVNETQTYWKLTDDGPSFEAAEDVHRSLVRNLGVGANRLLPGNYAVLRGCDAPAILTESSYLTYPPTEARLRTTAAQQLEAEALYLGLARWFARGVVRGRPLAGPAQGVPVGPVDDAGPSLAWDVRGEFDSWDLRVDGVPATAERFGDRLTWRPRAPLAPGWHEVTLLVRLAVAGASRAQTARFFVRAMPRRVELSAPFQGAIWSPDDAALGVRARVTDDFGRATSEPARVRFRALGGGMSPAETLAVVRDGWAWAYLQPRAPKPSATSGERLRVRAELLDSSGVAQSSDTLLVTGWNLIRTGEAVRAVTDSHGAPLSDALGTTGAEPPIGWLNRDGLARLRRRASRSGPVYLEMADLLPGYRRDLGELEASGDWLDIGTVTRFTPLFGGALHGRRIAIDPAGNGDIPGVPGGDPAGASASGTRAADANLDVARSLASMLRAAGADVLLVRDSPAPVLDVERVRRSEAFRAERYLRIGHGPHPPRLGYYYSSAGGRRWAEHTATALAALGLPAVPASPDAQWAIQQTSCPALYASLARIDDPAAESVLLAPGGVSREAYALLAGLAREWAPDADWPLDSLRVVVGDESAGGRGAVVTLGDALVLEPGPDGTLRFLRTEPGPLGVTVRSPSLGAVRSVLLDAQRGAVLNFGR